MKNGKVQKNVRAAGQRMLAAGQRFQRRANSLCPVHAKESGQHEPTCKAHRNQIRLPLLLAILSICFSPVLLIYTIGSVSQAAHMSLTHSICGLNVISGSLALAGYLFGLKYFPKNRLVRIGRNLSLFHGIALLVLAWPLIEDWSIQMVDWLFTLVQNPLAYLTFVLIFSILAAMILPIPVEAVLLGFIYYLIEPNSEFLGLGVAGAFILIAIVMGVGKALGAWVVFVIGIKAEKLVETYLSWRWFQRLLKRVQRFCVKFGYLAMFLVMSVPMMTDTVPLYVFSILNKDGKVFERNWFVLTNLWAGIARTLIVGIMAVAAVKSTM